MTIFLSKIQYSNYY